MLNVSQPTAAQCRDLVALREDAVTEADLDLNGHMNASRFFNAHVLSARSAFASVGVNEEYVALRKMGTFAVEQHIRYLGELRLGERYSVRPRFLGRTEKAVHLVSFLVNESTDSLASVLEIVSLHVDQVARRTTVIAADVATQLDERIRRDRCLSWEVQEHLSLRPVG